MRQAFLIKGTDPNTYEVILLIKSFFFNLLFFLDNFLTFPESGFLPIFSHYLSAFEKTLGIMITLSLMILWVRRAAPKEGGGGDKSPSWYDTTSSHDGRIPLAVIKTTGIWKVFFSGPYN